MSLEYLFQRMLRKPYARLKGICNPESLFWKSITWLKDARYSVDRFKRKIVIVFGLSTENREETKALRKSYDWLDRTTAQTYLTNGLEDPRINPQSILIRHFLITELFEEFFDIMKQEIEFGLKACVKVYLGERLSEEEISTFQALWVLKLKEKTCHCITVLDAGCGSANDYRYMHAYGMAKFLNYRGFDLCGVNIKNAKEMFPDDPLRSFSVGNIFDINAKDYTYDYILACDIFECFSLPLMEKAFDEMCRVANKGMALCFFNMSEIPAHKAVPFRYYHWNELSASQIKQYFIAKGFSVKVILTYDLLPSDCKHLNMGYEKDYTFLIRRR